MYAVGSIVPFAFDYCPPGFLRCDGALLPIAGHEPLFFFFGCTFGGDGKTTFALPSMPPLVPGLSHFVCAQAATDTDGPFTGAVQELGFAHTIYGFLPCDGRLLAILRDTTLFTLLGTRFGGDGRATFALPLVPPRKPGMSYQICVQGLYPGRSARC